MPKGKKTGGRQKGTPNKTTQAQREAVLMILDEEKVKIREELSALKGYEYLKIILALMQFVIPRLTRTEIVGIRDAGVSSLSDINRLVNNVVNNE